MAAHPLTAAGLHPLRALIVDDEPAARWALRELVVAHGGEVVGECGDGESAVAAIQRLQPDLVLLDVQMPGLDGFGVLEAVGPERMPPVTFVTAYDQHAPRAFEVDAVDFLLKPIAPERFAASFARARARQPPAADADLATGLRELLADHWRQHWRRHFLVRTSDRLQVVHVEDVDWIEAEGNYLRLHERERALLFRGTLATVEKQLDPARFCRIQRGAILNLASVLCFERAFGGAMVARLRHDRRVTVQKRYVHAVLTAFGAPGGAASDGL